MDWRELEGVARDFVEATGLGALPVDLEVLAHCYEIGVAHSAQGAVAGSVMLAPQRRTAPRSRFGLAHELAHVAVAHMGLSPADDETAAHYVAGAILVPEKAMRALMRDTAHDLRALVVASGASWEACARRYVQVWSGYATIWDSAHRVRRVPSPWLSERPITTMELDQARECRAAREDVRTEGQSGSYYVGGEPPHERVVGVWTIDELGF